MQDCQVCGREFDPLTFQVVVPELARGFDRIDCAQSARALGAAGLAVAPLVAVRGPLEAALAPARAVGTALRPLVGAPVAAAGLLAAGTATAAYLWVGVLGGDTTSFPIDRAVAPAAFGHETVRAHVEPESRSAPVAGKPSQRPAPESVRRLVAESPPPVAPSGGSGSTEPPQPDTPPQPPGTAPEPPASPPPVVGPARPARPEPNEGSRPTGRGHSKTGRGHFKHGEEDGAHSPGHGHAKGKGEREGRGEGEGHGRDKDD